MPSSSQPRPNSRKPRPQVAKPNRTLDLTENAPKTKKRASQSVSNAPGAARRAQKKAEHRRKAGLALLVFAAVSAILGGTAFGAWQGHQGIWHEYKDVKSKVIAKEQTLRDLRAQLERGRKRLADFNHNSGRERALVENGFIRDGDRLLLFPKDAKK